MFDKAVEIQHTIQVARNQVLQGLTELIDNGDATDLVRHLTSLNLLLQAAEYIAADAHNDVIILRFRQQGIDAGWGDRPDGSKS